MQTRNDCSATIWIARTKPSRAIAFARSERTARMPCRLADASALNM
jgi:hypothetical protein